jgi:hypothetical protein
MRSETLPSVVTALAAFIEECAHMRAHTLPATDELGWMQRALHAEAAGRELLMAWLRPALFPTETPLGAELKRLLGLVQTLLLASTPEDSITPTLTVVSRHVELSDESAWLVRDLALLMVLAAREDGALDMVITLDTDDDQVRLRVETDRPGLASMPSTHPRIAAMRRALRPTNGTWKGAETEHGSWLIVVRVPVLVAQVASSSYDEVAR